MDKLTTVIGSESVSWHNDEDTDELHCTSEILLVPQINKTYKILFRYVSSSSLTKNEIAQIKLITSAAYADIKLLISQENTESVALPVQKQCYAIWMPPLLRENSFLYIKEDDPWEDFDGNTIASQPDLMQSIHLLKMRPSSLSYRFVNGTGNSRVHEFMCTVEVLERFSIEELTSCIATQGLFFEPAVLSGEVATLDYKQFTIRDNLSQEYFDWTISTKIANKSRLILQSANCMGDEIMTVVNPLTTKPADKQAS